VADDAAACPSCGSAIWQPAQTQVAVTPAPVALVPPTPAVPPAPAVPPPARAPEQLPLPTTDAATGLPPQRPAPPQPTAPPPLPAGTATVVPADPPAAGKRNRLAITAGTIVPLLAVVVLIVALPAHGAKPIHLPTGATDTDAQRDLRALAAAEETNLTATEVYTTDSAALAAAGYQPVAGKSVTILAGIHHKKGYCLVATAGRATPWHLYDSRQGGLVSSDFASQDLAQQACADTAITSYVTIS
jgi:hypothetical protein